MLIDSLKLKNFRNYSDFEIDFNLITVFVGNNGIGKSNIIEALGLLSYGKSYRARDENHLIKYEKNYAQILANSYKGKINFVITKYDNNIKKEVKINDINQKTTNIIGKIKAVLFTPESLKIVTDSPTQRRKFLDMVLSEIDYEYLICLIKLKKIIKQRNELIKKIKNNKAKIEELSFWDKSLAENAKKIILLRKNFIDFIDRNINEIYQEISNEEKSKIKISYDTKIKDLKKIDEYISQCIDREIEVGKTLTGPHLDDMKIFLNHRPASMIASRGEIRSIVLALKILEIKYIENKCNEKILLLLDDVFSELDEKRRRKILDIVKKNQTIITTTKADFLDKNIKQIKIVKL